METSFFKTKDRTGINRFGTTLKMEKRNYLRMLLTVLSNSVLKYYKVLPLFLLISCNTNQDTSFPKFYKDFDLYKRKGISGIDKSQAEQLKISGKTFYELIYHYNKLDSIVIANPYRKLPDMKLKVIYNDSVSLYITSYPSMGYDKYYKNYYVFINNQATQYTHWEDEDWLVITTNSHGSYGGAKVIESIDTINLEKQLLKKKVIKMRTMPSHTIHNYPNKLNDNFTFNTWLSNKGLDLD